MKRSHFDGTAAERTAVPMTRSGRTSETMNIGQASAAGGVSAKMIRYYESIGLIPAARRSESGYRHYTADDVNTLRFIRRARDLGFPVADIAELLSLWQDKGRASAEVKRISLEHVATLHGKIAELRTMADALENLAKHCQGDDRPNCPILEDLARPDNAVAAGAAPMRVSKQGGKPVRAQSAAAATGTVAASGRST